MKYNWQNMEYDEINDRFTCPEGKKLEYIKTREDKTETGFIQESRVYECSDCSNCAHKSECTKAQGNRQIRFNKKLWQLKNVAKRNLTSEKGLEMRGISDKIKMYKNVQKHLASSTYILSLFLLYIEN